MGPRVLLAMLLLAVAAPAAAAPVTLKDADALGRWLQRSLRRAKGPVELTTNDGWALTGTPERVDRRTTRLTGATLSYGPVRLEGRLLVERGANGAVTAELGAERWSVGDTVLGAARLALTWTRTAGWSGQGTWRQGKGDAEVQIAPRVKPKRCRRGQVCPPPPLRVAVSLNEIDLGAIVAATPEADRGVWAALSGIGTGTVRLGGEAADLQVDGHLRAALRWDDEPMGVATVDVLRAADAPEVELAVRLDGPLARGASLALRAPLRVDGQALTLEARDAGGWHAAARLQQADLSAWTAVFPVLGLAGRVDLRAELSGADLSVAMDGDALRWQGDVIGEAGLHAQLHAGVARGAMRWGPTPAPYASLGFSLPLDLDPAALSLTWRHREPLRVSLRATGLTPARLRPFWRAHPAAAFTVDAQVDAEGTLGAITGEGRLTGELADGDRPPLPLAAALKVRPTSQRLEATVGKAITISATTKLPLLAWREGKAHPGTAEVTGALSLAVPLSTLAPYLPGDLYEPVGQLDGAFTASGTLAAPAFTGQAALQDGAVTIVNAHQRLTALALKAEASDNQLTMSEVSARSGVGTWSGTGRLVLDATPEGGPTAVPLWSAWQLKTELDVTAQRVPFIQPLTPAGLADGHLSLRATQRPGETEAVVVVDGARVDLMDIRMPPAAAVPHNGRVRIVDWTGRARSPDRLFMGEDHLTLTITLGEPVVVEGDGVRLRIGGSMGLDRTAERAEVTGGFDVLEGEFTLFENRFTLRRGRLSLQGGSLVTAEGDLTAETARLRDPDAPPKAAALEPVFDWLAEGDVVGTYVDMAIRGPARRPELVLASDPPLPEYRILTLLVTGRVDAVDGRNGDVRRQVAKLVDRFHNPSLSRQLYDRLGVDKLGLKFKSLTQPVLTVGKQLNRQLYVETVYHHNAPPDENEKEARVEYRLDPAWTLDTTYGDAAVGSVGVFWKRDFGGPPPQRKATRPLAQEGANGAGK